MGQFSLGRAARSRKQSENVVQRVRSHNHAESAVTIQQTEKAARRHAKQKAGPSKLVAHSAGEMMPGDRKVELIMRRRKQEAARRDRRRDPPAAGQAG